MEPVGGTESIRIERLRLGPFETNSYLLTCSTTGESLLVDAPAEASKILKASERTHPRYLLITHNHGDHIGALSELKSKLRIPIGAHRLDSKGLPVQTDILLEDGARISWGNLTLEVLHTPGHTPGSLCFFVGKQLISGDTIFPGGPGKTNSPTDFRRIIESISRKILALPDDTVIYPGHGGSTNVRKEKEEFALFSSRSHDPKLCGDVLWGSS